MLYSRHMRVPDSGSMPAVHGLGLQTKCLPRGLVVSQLVPVWSVGPQLVHGI